MSKTSGVGIRIRMYRVGFGDFFLVSFGDQHVVIDCGVFKGTTGKGDVGSIEAAIDDMLRETKKKLALIVMTHRHADHIAGFGRFADAFRGCKVDAVWMSTWEDEYNPTAKKFQAELTAMALQMQAHLDPHVAATSEDNEHFHALYHRVGNATGNLPSLGARAGGGGHSANAVALDLLKTGFDVKPAYLKADDPAPLPASLKHAGVTVRVLGPPPVEDLDLMKLMDLKKHVGEYLAIASGVTSVTAGNWEPFSNAWYMDPSKGSAAAFREWMPDHGQAGDGDFAAARARLEQQLQETSPTSLALAAKKLDSFLNNQSLVLLFTYKGKNLLFVGDAQGGNWEHWLYDTDDADKAPTGPLATKAKQILDHVDVYKVGHHGSTNATPIAVSREIRKGAVALCSTQKGVYGESKETAVPLQELMDALDKQTALVRSDQIEITVDKKKVKPAVTRPLPKKTDGTLETGQLWIDYHL